MRTLTAFDLPEDWCLHFKALDREHGTSTDSPLHHDNRCGYCRTETDEEYAARQRLEVIRIRALNNEVRANSDR